MVEEEIKTLREVSLLEWTYCVRPKITENVLMRWTPASFRALQSEMGDGAPDLASVTVMRMISSSTSTGQVATQLSQ